MATPRAVIQALPDTCNTDTTGVFSNVQVAPFVPGELNQLANRPRSTPAPTSGQGDAPASWVGKVGVVTGPKGARSAAGEVGRGRERELSMAPAF